MMALPAGGKSLTTCATVSTQYRHWTYRQRQSDRQKRHISTAVQ